MKKTTLTLITFCSLFIAQSSFGVIKAVEYDDYKDVDRIGHNLLYGTQFTGIFDIVNDDGDSNVADKWGFDPSTETITKAAVAFSFKQIVEGVKVVSILDYDFDFGTITEGGSGEWNFVLDSASGGIGLKLVSDIQQDGLLNWGITLLTPDGMQDGDASDVTLHYGIMGVKVPDSGSTFALLGAALFGMICIRRRF